MLRDACNKGALLHHWWDDAQDARGRAGPRPGAL